MVSWASVAKKEPPRSGAAPLEAIGQDEPVAVLDANAIIGGLSVQRALDRLVTIPEALQEVRDKQSREALEALPFRVELMEPSEDSVRAVTRFARATGDLHSLSAVDLRLMALARTLEVAAHGDGHLRELPAPPRPLSRRPRRAARALSGWDAQGGEWAAMDALAEQEELAAEAARDSANAEAPAGADDISRIAAGVQALDLGSGDVRQSQGFAQPAGAQRSDAADGQANGATTRAQHAEQRGAEHDQPAEVEAEHDTGSEWSDDDEGDDDEADEWQIAGKSQNSARRQRRKARRRAAWEAAHGGSVAASAQEASDDVSTGDDSSSDGSGGDDEAAPAADDESVAPSCAGMPSQSNVSCVTADFAMQNVMLQMGLRVVAPGGLAISRLSRHVLRCSACFLVTKEVGRLFCPRCGNATVEKVEVLTGPDGQEQYGVRRKHNLRGTRFSLPKPKGGRAAKNEPILREDILLQRMPHMRPRPAEEADPFAPEYSNDSWHTKHPTTGQQAKGAAVALAGWKHNPNERKFVRTNRRRK